MKKLLITLLSVSLLLQSCSFGTSYDKAPKEGEIVLRIESSIKYPDLCIYTTQLSPISMFYARKGLYNVGDTVKFCK